LALAATALLVITSPGAQFARGASTGLVAAFSFDEGTGSTATDSSGAGLVATLSNTTWSSGHSGRALSFDGSDSWATIPDRPSLDLSTGMTLEAWVDPSGNSKGWRTAIAKEQTGDLAYGLYTSSSSGPAELVYTGGDKYVFSSSNLASGHWRHVAATFDGATERLYVNGSLVATAPAAGSMPNSGNPLRIGGNAVRGQWFRGLIDDVRIYNRPLAASEIRTDMQTPVPSPSAAPVTAPADSQAPSVPGRLAVTAASSSSVSVSWTASNDNVGVAGYSLYLNGAVWGGTDSTSFSFTGLTCGTSYTFGVDAYDAAGNRSAQASLVSATAPCSSSSLTLLAAPTNTSAPTISGSALVGSTLTASAGSWSGNPTQYAYQWQSCSADMTSCSNIAGSTAATYTPVTGDVGGRDRVKVTATNASGSTVAYSQPTSVVQAAAATGWTFGRQTPGSLWYAMGADYKRSSRFTLDRGGTVTALVAYLDAPAGSTATQQIRYAIYSDSGGEPASLVAQSVVTTISAGTAPAWVKLPLEKSTALAAGSYHLAILSGASSGVVRYSREPLASGLRSTADAFADGASSSYGSAAADNYEIAIYALVTSAAPSTSSAPVSTVVPAVSGLAQVGQTLTASPGQWNAVPDPTFSYQWLRCGTSGSGCTAIAGASGSSYLLGAADAGATLRVQVTATNSAGSASATSPQTSTVAAPTVATGSTVGCDKYASPLGVDANAGTLALPLRTVGKLLDSLSAGQTGCLVGSAGPFALEDLTIDTPDITLTSVPGQRATFRGSLYLNSAANGVTLRDFDLDNTDSTRIAVKLNADDVTISNMDITNDNKPNGTSNYNGICVLAGPGFEQGDAYIVSNLVVEKSRIHNCGDDAHEHSLYLEGTRNPIIRDNYLYGNYGIGLDLYPDTQGMIAEYNVIYGNSRAGKENVGFAGEVAGGEYSSDHASSNNVVRYNVITNPVSRYNVDSYFPSTKVRPAGNAVTDNCVWNAPMGNFGYDNSGDYAQSDNKDVDPRYVDAAAADFRLQSGSPCAGWGPRVVPAT
jgi:chitodextrinase